MSPRTRRLLLALGVAVVAIAILLEIAVPADHGPGWVDVWFHHVPGFHALVGFGGCWLIVKGSKLLGRLWLQRPEGYYGEAQAEAEAEAAAGAAAGGPNAHGGSHGR